MKGGHSIGIDIGGTNIKGVLLSEEGEFIHKTTHSSSGADWKTNVLEVYQELRALSNADTTLGISAPGIADKEETKILYMPGRLSGLEGLEWAEYLDHQGAKVLNDAHAALVAEAALGAGKGNSNMILLTLGTGVGGAIMINNKIFKGANGMAGHFGHISVENYSEISGIVGLPGTLEEAVGECSIERRSKGAFQSYKDLIEKVKTSDPAASLIWNNTLKQLALGISSLINIISPELIILGGGITKADSILFNPLKALMDKYEWKPHGLTTPIVKAQFDTFAGAVGAAVNAQKNNI